MCCPNDGFLEQLHAFDVMNKKLLTQHPAYKKYRLQHLAEQWQETSTVDTSMLANPTKSTGQVHSPSDTWGSLHPEGLYNDAAPFEAAAWGFASAKFAACILAHCSISMLIGDILCWPHQISTYDVLFDRLLVLISHGAVAQQNV